MKLGRSKIKNKIHRVYKLSKYIRYNSRNFGLILFFFVKSEWCSADPYMSDDCQISNTGPWYYSGDMSYFSEGASFWVLWGFL